MSLDVNETVSSIAKEAAKLDPLEQQMLLTKLRVKGLKKGSAIVSNSLKAIKNKVTLKQIDKWKHESRIKNQKRKVRSGQ